jgi:hypothetical protein
MPVCAHCGAPFDADGYHVAAHGLLYDSIDCALTAAASRRRRREDPTSDWLAAARQRLGLDEPSTNVGHEPDDH